MKITIITSLVIKKKDYKAEYSIFCYIPERTINLAFDIPLC